MHRHSPRAGASLAALVALTALLPLPASAQFGGLAKRAKAAVADRVEAALPFTPKPAPEFTDRVLEITEPRLDGLLRGFEAELTYARTASREYEDSVKAYERRHKEWEKGVEAYDKAMERYAPCQERFEEQEQAASAANTERADRVLAEMSEEEFEEYMEDLALRGEEVANEVMQGKNDPVTQKKHEDYRKEVQLMVAEQNRRMATFVAANSAERRRERTADPRLVEACGPAPERPVEPISPLASPEGVLAARGAEAAGLTAPQYSIMRERVLNWARYEGRPTMGFAQAEIDLLDERSGDVTELVEKMRKGKVPL